LEGLTQIPLLHSFVGDVPESLRLGVPVFQEPKTGQCLTVHFLGVAGSPWA
jgi:hypothetical protein